MADRNLLARATEQSSSPTPGYLYNDIAKQCASSPSISSEVLSYLLRRLAKNNAHVKYKALKTIAMVCTNPNSRGVFKRTVIQDHNAVSEIKGCLNYRGKADAVHGDQLGERVRTQAKDTLDCVYSDDPSSNMNMGSMGGGGGMSSMSGSYGQGVGGGYGSQSGGYGAGGGAMGGGMTVQPGGMPGTKRMEGIGNPMFKDPRLDAGNGKTLRDMTITDVMSVAKEGMSAAKDGFVGIIKDPLARKAMGGAPGAPRPGSMSNVGSYGGGGYGGSGGYGAPTHSSSWSAPPGQAQLASATNGQWTMASNRGPNAISSSDSYGNTYKAGSNNVASGIGGSWGASSSNNTSVAAQARMPNHNPINHNPVVNISGPPGAANTSGTFEKNLIMELCPPGGMKPEPPADKLASFCQSLPDLNSDLICPALLDMLEDGQPWVIRAKVLCVMERCVEVGEEMAKNNEAGNNVYADFFHMCCEEIKPLANHSRSAVREPARRVLKILGIDTPAKANTASAPPAAKAPVAAAPAPNLLDFDDEPQTQGAPQPPAVPPPPVPSEAPPVPPAAEDPIPPTLTNGNKMSGADLFGGMTIKSSSSTNVSATAATAPAPAAQSDLFGDGDNTSVQPTPTPTSGASNASIFDSMVVKPDGNSVTENAANVTSGKENVENVNEAQNQAPAETVAAPSASGFSFLNTGANDSTGTSEPKQIESAQTPKQSFDPLLSMAAPSSTMAAQPAPMAMSAQMAAVMQQQQQQIRMMQAQMQQMQMGGTGGNPGVGGQFYGAHVGGVMGAQQQTPRMAVMGGMGGSGVATSFAFMEDPNKVKREASNKKFDFVQDAMKSAR